MTERKRYRYRDLKPGDAYYEAWRSYRWRDQLMRRGTWLFLTAFAIAALVLGLILLGFIPIEAWASFPLRYWFKAATGVLAFFGLIMVMLGHPLCTFSNCPRCGARAAQRFNGNWLGPWSSTCRSCGLSKWAPDASSSDFAATARGARVSKAIESLVMRTYSVDEQQEVLELLAKYGQEDWHRETERVQRAALKLAEGSLRELRKYIAEANVDYRDVICMAEYPDA